MTFPIFINFKVDPFERFIKARGYDEYAENGSWLFKPAMMQLNEFVETLKIIPKATGFFTESG